VVEHQLGALLVGVEECLWVGVLGSFLIVMMFEGVSFVVF